jgi:hypothetical protein
MNIEWNHKNNGHYAYIGNRCVGLVRQYNERWGATIKGFAENKYFESLDNAKGFLERLFNGDDE